jgi:hypothetical protein
MRRVWRREIPRARGIERLPPSYKSLKPGFHADGGGLYLQNWQSPGSWIFRFQLAGAKPRDMGLGSVITFSLAEVRETAREMRKLVAKGLDPIACRDAERAQNRAAITRGISFDAACEAYIAAKKAA